MWTVDDKVHVVSRTSLGLRPVRHGHFNVCATFFQTRPPSLRFESTRLAHTQGETLQTAATRRCESGSVQRAERLHNR